MLPRQLQQEQSWRYCWGLVFSVLALIVWAGKPVPVEGDPSMIHFVGWVCSIVLFLVVALMLFWGVWATKVELALSAVFAAIGVLAYFLLAPQTQPFALLNASICLLIAWGHFTIARTKEEYVRKFGHPATR